MNMHTVHNQHLHDDCLEQTLFVPTCHRQRHGTELPGGVVHIHAVALEQQVHVGAAEVVHRVPEVKGASSAPAQQAAADGVTLTRSSCNLGLPQGTSTMLGQSGAARTACSKAWYT